MGETVDDAWAEEQMPDTDNSNIDLDWLHQAVAGLFAGNRLTRKDNSGREWTYHAPSLGPFPGRYPHQWFWDSCAHAISLRHIDIRLACEEITSLLAAQDENGFIPHQVLNRARANFFDRIAAGVYPSRGHSPYLQAPVLAQAVQAIQVSSPEEGFLLTVLPCLKRYHHYLRRTRERSGDGLLEIIHSYESGKDRSREYDQVYGQSLGVGLRAWPMIRLILKHRFLGWDIDRIFDSNAFRVKDLLFNCAYAGDLLAMATLCRDAGQPAEAESFTRLLEQTEAGILGKMYDPETGLFNSLDSRHGADGQIKVRTVSTFLPLLLGSISEGQVRRLLEELCDPSEYWLRFPVPAEPRNSPEAGRSRTGIWRGLQTWIFMNWFIVRGLHRQAGRYPGLQAQCLGTAAELTRRTYQLVRQSGFREYYDSDTGAGERAFAFGMSGLVLDMACMVR